MKLEHLHEPRLRFASGDHICPRRGITAYGVFDKSQTVRRSDIMVGGIGSGACLEALTRWLERCGSAIEARADTRQPNLFTGFCGFNLDSGFGARLVFGNDLSRTIKKSEIDNLLLIENWRDRVNATIELYYENSKFLAQNRHVDVVVCVIPDALHKKIAMEETYEIDETLDTTVVVPDELNFRRALKAKAMHLGKPLQLIRAVSLESNKRGQQDDATKAWNFCTALYYKSGPTIPWKLPQNDSRPSSCAVAYFKAICPRLCSSVRTSGGA